MSEASGIESSLLGRLPGGLRPREVEAPGSGRRRLVETTVLLLVFLLLALATVRDVVRAAGVNHRLAADLRTWRSVTGHDYHNLSTEQDIKGYSTRDVICGNTSPGAPGERTQVCFVMTGPIVKGQRAARGGYYLPPTVHDQRARRYACFGSAKRPSLCPR
ncbi:MAG TPA: hypothetical protein VGG98_10445 [Solirubrobacteraceae bacterium]|jgi:hypothetical protein